MLHILFRCPWQYDLVAVWHGKIKSHSKQNLGSLAHQANAALLEMPFLRGKIKLTS